MQTLQEGSSVQSSSRWHVCVWKSPYALCPVSQKFPQHCLWTGSSVWLTMAFSHHFKEDCLVRQSTEKLGILVSIHSLTPTPHYHHPNKRTNNSRLTMTTLQSWTDSISSNTRTTTADWPWQTYKAAQHPPSARQWQSCGGQQGRGRRWWRWESPPDAAESGGLQWSSAAAGSCQTRCRERQGTEEKLSNALKSTCQGNWRDIVKWTK